MEVSRNTAAQVQISHAVSNLNCRISSLITYYFSMWVAGLLDENMVPKRNAPYFAGHPTTTKNVFSPNRDEFLLNINEALIGRAHFIKRKIIQFVAPIIYRQVTEAVKDLSSRVLQDAHAKIRTLSQDPSETSIAFLGKAKEIIAKILPKYADSLESPQTYLPKLELDEEMLIAEWILSDLKAASWTAPYKYLIEASHRCGIELDILKPKTQEILRSYGISGDPKSFEELDALLERHEKRAEIDYNIKKALLELAIDETIENLTIPSPNANKDKEALRRRIWEKQIELLEPFIPTRNFNVKFSLALRQYAKYKTLVDQNIIKYQALHLALKKYKFRNFSDARQFIEKRSSILSTEFVIFKRSIKEEAILIERQLASKSRFDLFTGFYEQLLSSIIRKYLIPKEIQFTASPEVKAKSIYNNWISRIPANSYALVKPIYVCMGAIMSILGYIHAMTINRAYNFIAHHTIVYFIEKYLAKVARAIFTGLVDTLTKKDGLKGDLFTLLNEKLTEKETKPAAPPIKQTKPAAASTILDQEIELAQDLLESVLKLSQSKLLNSPFVLEKLAKETALALHEFFKNETDICALASEGLNALSSSFESWNATSVDSELVRSEDRKKAKLFYEKTIPHIQIPYTRLSLLNKVIGLFQAPVISYFSDEPIHAIITAVTHPQTLNAAVHRLVILATNHLNHTPSLDDQS
jgi:hypothetical protein